MPQVIAGLCLSDIGKIVLQTALNRIEKSVRR